MESSKHSLSLRIIHWFMAVFIIGVLCDGFYIKSLPASNGIKFSIYAIHKACGTTVIGFVILRILLRAFTYVPQFHENFSGLVIVITKVVHFNLYLLMILIPLSGYVMSSASVIQIKYFFRIPLIIGKNKELAGTANLLHSVLAYLLVCLITLHTLGALKHLFIGKQNIFKRVI